MNKDEQKWERTPREEKPAGRLTTRRMFVSYLGIIAATGLLPALSGCSMTTAIKNTLSNPNTGSASGAAHVTKPEPSLFPTARLVVLSDTHIDPDFTASVQHMPAALQAIMRFDPAPDAIVLNGDIVNHGREEEYELVRQIAADAGFAFPDDFIVAMGDHEQWGPLADGYDANYTGQREVFLRNCHLDTLYYDTYVNGEHVIVLAPDEDPTRWDRMRISDIQLEWLDKLLAYDQSQGVRSFVVLHEPADNTVPYTYEGEQKHGANESSAALKKVVGKYRDAIVISGHTHSPAACVRPDANGPVYVCDGAVAYLRDDAFTDAISEAGQAESRGILIDIFPDRTEFTAWDFVLDDARETYISER